MFPISYRNLELMLQDRGIEIAHTTIFRWIQAYAPEFEKRIRPRAMRGRCAAGPAAAGSAAHRLLVPQPRRLFARLGRQRCDTKVEVKSLR
jgi:hypothetical protein